jgi:hypothetical protein
MNDRFELILRKARCYQTIFNKENQAARVVLADLARFCRATKPTFCGENTHQSALLEGRREVFLRILENLEITEADLKLYMEHEK